MSLPRIALLGIGAMGSRMATNWCRAGYPLTVWNRSAAACEALQTAGAQLAASPAEAVADATLVVSMLRDDPASEDVWLGSGRALEALPAEAVAMESSTLSPDHVQRLGRAFEAAERTLIEAPVVGSLAQVEAGQLRYLLGGPRLPEPVWSAVKAALEVQAAHLEHVGEYGSAARLKLAVNSLLTVQAAALAEILSALESVGMSRKQVVKVLNGMPTASPAAQGLGLLMANGQAPPSFPLALVAKDMDYAGSIFHPQGELIPATQRLLQQALKSGFGEKPLAGLLDYFQSI